MTIPTLPLALASTLLAGVSAPAFAQDGASEEAAVRAALENYILAHATGEGAYAERIFHPVAHLFFLRDGALQDVTSQAYIDRFPGEPAPDEAARRRWIDRVDVTGDAAVARIVLDYPDAKITDYMSLLKIDGEWKIVNKIFHADPRKDP